MSIYSTNRTGSFNVAQIAANESYSWNDIGRILCESQANDMAFFEAALACDFNEVKGLHEGTILESEVEALNSESKDKFIDKLIDRLKAFWAKLKGVLQSAIEKLAEVALDGKRFVKEFDSKVSAKALSDWAGSVDARVFDLHHKCLDVSNAYDSVKKDANISAALSNMLGDGEKTDLTPNTYAKAAIELCSVTDTLKADNVAEYKTAVAGAYDHIKELKRRKTEIEGMISKQIESLKAMKGKAKEGSHASNMYEDLIAKHQTEEVVMATVVKTAIIVTKEDMKSRRVALRKAMGDILKTDKEMHEAAVLDDAEAFEDTMNTGVPTDPETKKAIDDLVASVEVDD